MLAHEELGARGMANQLVQNVLKHKQVCQLSLLSLQALYFSTEDFPELRYINHIELSVSEKSCLTLTLKQFLIHWCPNLFFYKTSGNCDNLVCLII